MDIGNRKFSKSYAHFSFDYESVSMQKMSDWKSQTYFKSHLSFHHMNNFAFIAVLQQEFHYFTAHTIILKFLNNCSFNKPIIINWFQQKIPIWKLVSQKVQLKEQKESERKQNNYSNTFQKIKGTWLHDTALTKNNV